MFYHLIHIILFIDDYETKIRLFLKKEENFKNDNIQI